MNRAFWILVLATQLVSSRAEADDDVTVGAFVGGHLFSRELELGAFDSPGSDSPANNVAFGVRTGYQLLPSLALEAELAIVPSRARGTREDLTVVAWRGHALIDLLPDDRLRPIAIVGLGFLTLSPSNTDGLEEDTDLAAHLGLGLEYDLGPQWALRVDARVVFAPTTAGESLTRDFEFFLGAVRRFGDADLAEPSDGDGDGVFDPQDQCPDAVEDQDGFDDEDGCPDLDNDLDGVSDRDDRCPAEAESPNGIDDGDGCPEADGDGDGVIGSQDLCPQEAEDLDGVDDADGCPDPAPLEELPRQLETK